MPGEDERWLGVWERVTESVSRWAIGVVVIATIAGTTQGVTAWLLGSSFALALGVIAGLLDMIPNIGATIAGFILVPALWAEEGIDGRPDHADRHPRLPAGREQHPHPKIQGKAVNLPASSSSLPSRCLGRCSECSGRSPRSRWPRRSRSSSRSSRKRGARRRRARVRSRARRGRRRASPTPLPAASGASLRSSPCTEAAPTIRSAGGERCRVEDERPRLWAAEAPVEGDELLEGAALVELRVVEAPDHDVRDVANPPSGGDGRAAVGEKFARGSAPSTRSSARPGRPTASATAVRPRTGGGASRHADARGVR